MMMMINNDEDFYLEAFSSLEMRGEGIQKCHNAGLFQGEAHKLHRL